MASASPALASSTTTTAAPPSAAAMSAVQSIMKHDDVKNIARRLLLAMQIAQVVERRRQQQHQLKSHDPRLLIAGADDADAAADGAITPAERGQLIALLQVLYQREEQSASEALASAQAQARAMAAHAAAMGFSSAGAARALASAAAKAGHASAAAATIAARHAVQTSLTPALAASNCCVCYAAFHCGSVNAAAAGETKDNDSNEPVLRVQLRLCGHNSICTDCFSAYLTNRVQSDDVLPYVPCPCSEECRMPIHHLDLTAAVPSVHAARAAEAELLAEQSHIAARNSRAFNALHARALPLGAAVAGSSDAGLDAPAFRTRSSAKHADVSAGAVASPATTVTDQPGTCASRHPRGPPYLSSDLLLKLVISHASKLLRRSPDWLPCGTHVKSATTTTDSGSTTTATTAASACVYGFVLTPGKAAKLHKCEACGVLQTVAPRLSGADGGNDPGLAELVKAGTLRPCPACSALNGKDYGMCNVIQCYACQIWWNWQSRETGKSQSALKAHARAMGTLWLPGELAYQQTLQRTDIEAFKALLARNGIEYDPAYVRGS